MWGEINKEFLKRLKQITNKELLATAYSFKIQNRVCDSPITRSKSFQRNYDTLIVELKERKLWGGK